jgi:ATP-dependent Clp protease protease subunit
MISNSNLKGQTVKKIDEFNAQDRIGVKLLENAIHFLTGDIEGENIQEAIRWIVYENLDVNKDKPLTLYINSPGGDLYQAFALIDIMRSSRRPIRTIAIGSAMSAAFLIFSAGTAGERWAAKNTGFMCHQFSDSQEGKYHDIKAQAKESDLCNQKMIDILKEATGLPTAKIKSKLLPASDVYLSAEELVELKICDHIL